jgi:hypothetical protein
MVKRAVELFRLDRRRSCSRFVEESWRARSAAEASFTSVAACHWEIVVTRRGGAGLVTVRGPETRATTVPIPPDAEFFGIQFRLGTFMPSLLPARLVDRSVELPQLSNTTFWLDGSAWELPGPDTADAFVDRLVGAGLLVQDPIVTAALDGEVDGLSTRSAQRRVVRATGLTRGAIRQIRRAEQAVALLAGGVSTVDVANRAGYADQAHLTRSLKRFVGDTPSRVVAPGG